MKKINLLFFTSMLSSSFIIPFTTSCSLFENLWTMPRSIDGSNWTGVLSGKFIPNDYFVDVEHQEVHYWNGEEIVAQDLVIPNYVWYNGQKFKVIIDPICFDKSSTIVGTVELNDWMTELPNYIFNECVNIKSIIFHNYPTRFGEYSLNKCLSLENIYVRLPDNSLDQNWIINVKTIGDFAFSQTAISGNLIFPASIESIGENAFDGCTYLTYVNLKFCTNIEKISPWCFANCNLVKSVSLPVTINEIGDSAFFKCSDLEEVILSQENQVIALDNNAFRECVNFVNFSIQPIITKIGEACFYGNKMINFKPWLDARNQDLEIGMNAFGFCGFASLQIKSDVTINPDSYAFADCKNLTLIDFSSFDGQDDVPEWVGEDIFSSTVFDGMIQISQGIHDEMQSTGKWLEFFYNSCGWQTLEDQGWTFVIKK